jgi:hypothetical protein
MFQAKQFGEKRCMICGRQAKGMQVTFDDGTLNGFLCFKDIQKQAENRAEDPNEQPENGEPAVHEFG